MKLALAPINRSHVICLLVFLLFAGIGAYWTHMGQTLYRKEQRFYMNELIQSQAYAIERRLQRSLSSTRILAQAVRQHGGIPHDFDAFAAEVLDSLDGIANLQLAPDGIVRSIYPLAGNERALGHNLLGDARRAAEAQQAIEQHRLTLAGPLQLVQGGVAVIGRNPVFLADGSSERFWGFASAVILLDDLLAVTDLGPHGRSEYSYQLSRTHPDSGQQEVFSRSDSALTSDSYTVEVEVPGASWQLSMSRAKPTPKWRSTTGYIASVLAGLLTAWVAFILLRQPEKLRRVVAEKTRALERLAYHDHLTDLVNRRYLGEQLNRILREYPRYHHAAALMYLDLDDFKRINDSLGHDAGDSLLQQIASRLRDCVRISDVVARLGGDEFGILLLDADSIRDAGVIAAKLIAAVERPVYLGDKSFVVSTSVGITLIPTDGEDAATLLSNADMAMYAAKRAGKRNFRFYDHSLQAHAVAKLKLEQDLAAAINQQQFVLHYQPIVDLDQGRLSGYEALIRWQHPQHGLLYPDRFIQLAEESGKIIAIGYWVLEAVCQQLRRDTRNGVRCSYSVNLSPRQFKDPQLLENIRTIVRATDVDARLLELEVTESCVMEDVEDAIATLQQLKALGISIAIDDFGTGYSSLAWLKKLPVDRLKIDRSFVIDLETDPSDQKIVQALISMAHKLQLKVVAEGIETASQLRLLKDYHCDLGQGYFYSKPLPLEQLPPLPATPA